MYQIVYASSATQPFDEKALRALLEVSQRNNARVNVTGMLLYREGNFIQVLEGEESAVQETYDRIARDPRHCGVLPFLKGDIAERDFPAWSMAYRNLDRDAASIPGFSEFLNFPLTGNEFATDPSRCQRLLMVFKENFR